MRLEFIALPEGGKLKTMEEGDEVLGYIRGSVMLQGWKRNLGSEKEPFFQAKEERKAWKGCREGSPNTKWCQSRSISGARRRVPSKGSLNLKFYGHIKGGAQMDLCFMDEECAQLCVCL